MAVCAVKGCFCCVAACQDVFQQRHVAGIGEFHIFLVALHKFNLGLRNIFQHHTAVVRCMKVRVGKCFGISFLDERKAECLRCLHSSQGGSVELTSQNVRIGLHHGVNGIHRHAHGFGAGQSTAYAADNLLRNKRTCGIVQQEVHLATGVGLDGGHARMIAFCPSCEHLAQLAPSVFALHLPDSFHVVGMHHYSNFIDVGILLKGIYAVGYHGSIAQHQKLFGHFSTGTAAASAGQHHGYVGYFVHASLLFVIRAKVSIKFHKARVCTTKRCFLLKVDR